MKSIVKTALLITLIIASMAAWAQKKNDNERKRHRDIHIMEGVLDKVLAGEREDHRWASSASTRGVYVNGYGMIFQVTRPISHRYFVDAARNYEKELAAMKARVEDLRTAAEKAEKEETAKAQQDKQKQQTLELIQLMSQKHEETLEQQQKEVKSRLVEFYSKYIPAINDLDSNDRVAVLVQFGNSSSDKQSTLASWISKADLDQLRKRRITREQFTQRIHFNGQSGRHDDVQQDIDILLEILSRAMRSSRSYFSSGGAKGLYLEGFGALLTMHLPNFHVVSPGDGEFMVVGENSLKRALNFSKGEANDVSVVVGINQDEKEDEKKKAEARLQQTKNEIFELLADYGHTLRLKPDEHVLLNVGREGFGYAWSTGSRVERSDFRIHLLKKDIDAYSDGRINLEELKKRQID